MERILPRLSDAALLGLTAAPVLAALNAITDSNQQDKVELDAF